jgi:flagellar biosynthesis protein FlhF
MAWFLVAMRTGGSMSMRRFVAPTARDCLRKVKEELGAEAIVVSNKPVTGGIEIMAMTAEGFEAFSRQLPQRASSTPSPVAPRPAISHAGGAAQRAYASQPTEMAMPQRPGMAARTAVDDDYTVSLSARVRAPVSDTQSTWPAQARVNTADTVSSAGTRSLRPLPGRETGSVLSGAEVKATLETTLRDTGAATGAVSAANATNATSAISRPESQSMTDSSAQLQVAQLMGEMHTIRALLERQLAGFAWGELSRESPVRALALAEMLDAGFSGLLARKLCQELPDELKLEEARKWLTSALNRRLRTLNSDNDIIDRGGVYALVGPTGVGKTTTTAKLAARCVVRYGADKIALLTTDGYRIGAHEQLRIYGRILGVPVHVVRDGDDLRHTLADLRDKHIVLIDTVGMNQRDRMVAEQAAMLTRAGEVNRLLLLNATSRGDTLDDVISAYAGEDLAGVILSKVDETASLAPALDAVVRHGLLLCYIANGQRVPEDMHLPNRSYLMHRAFKLPGEASPHRLKNDEAGLFMTSAQTPRRASGGSLV